MAIRGKVKKCATKWRFYRHFVLRRGNTLCAIDGKGDNVSQAISAQRQHHQTINTQRHARAIRHPNLQRFKQVVVNWLLRQATRGTFTIILLKPLLLFTRIGQLMETIRQLNTFVINLKSLCDPMIFGTDLCQ